jgi:hypothetical protein
VPEVRVPEEWVPEKWVRRQATTRTPEASLRSARSYWFCRLGVKPAYFGRFVITRAFVKAGRAPLRTLAFLEFACIALAPGAVS